MMIYGYNLRKKGLICVSKYSSLAGLGEQVHDIAPEIVGGCTQNTYGHRQVGGSNQE